MKSKLRELRFVVDGQNIRKDSSCNFENVVSGSNNYLSCVFVFDTQYDDFGKVAEFISEKGKIKLFMLKNNQCVIPREVTDGSYFKVKVHLKRGDVTFSTNEIVVMQT